MNFAVIIKESFRAILRNRMRSFLTCVGIVVGIAAVPSALRKLVTAVIGLAVCIVAVRMALASGNGVAFADADLTWRTVSVLFCADILMSLFAVLAA